MVLGHDIHTSQRTQDVKIAEDHTFDSMLLSPNTLRGLNSAGFHAPSPIQLHGIPWGKCGCDLLLEAKSGTGKTAVFSVIALEQLKLDKGVQTLILAPTREIASQICDVIRIIGTYYEGLSVAVVMGGLPYEEDVKKFKEKVHIVVGSPGRLRHLIQDKHIDVSSIRLMVLDEADKLVDKSFLVDINYIFSLLPHQKQVIMSSATYSEKIKTSINRYVQNPVHICPDSNSILLGIEQQVTTVPNHINVVKQTNNRYEELIQILSRKQFKQCMVFCNYTARVDEVHRKLNKGKWPADKLCGQQEQSDRLEALKTLQAYNCRIMVTTDLTARGIDAPNVDLVINFEVPHDWQTYLHRIGRAGRFGSYGTAITILCEGNEERQFKNLLISMNMQFNLKYFWSKEPYALTEQIKESQNAKTLLQIEPEKKVDAEDMSDKLWKVLSTDSSAPKDNVPSFKSVCVSFEESNNNSKSEGIENFQDLLSSFQNHDIRSRDHSEYKPIKVNNLIIAFDVINQLFPSSKSKEGAVMVEKKRSEFDKGCGYKSKFGLENGDGCATVSKKNETIFNGDYGRDISKPREKDSLSENSVEECSNHDEVNHCIRAWKPECNKPSGSNFQSTEYPEQNTMLAANLPVAFRKSKNSNKTKHNETLCNPDYNNPICSRDSQSTSCDDEFYNALLAANLPMTYGKSSTSNNTKINQTGSKPGHNKPNCIRDLQTASCEALLAANLPVAFGKSIKPNSTTYHFRSNGILSYNKTEVNENSENTNLNQHQFLKTQSKNYDYKSSDSDEDTHKDLEKLNESKGSYKSKKSKTHNHYTLNEKQLGSDRENPHHNNENINYCDTPYAQYNHEIEERLQTFDQWYRNLQTYMLWIERSVYIAQMSKP